MAEDITELLTVEEMKRYILYLRSEREEVETLLDTANAKIQELEMQLSRERGREYED